MGGGTDLGASGGALFSAVTGGALAANELPKALVGAGSRRSAAMFVRFRSRPVRAGDVPSARCRIDPIPITPSTHKSAIAAATIIQRFAAARVVCREATVSAYPAGPDTFSASARPGE